MGLACLSLPEEFAPHEEFEAMAMEVARQWARAQRSLFAQEHPPTLKALCDRMQTSRLDLLGGLLKAQVETLAPELLQQAVAACPRCRQPVRRKRLAAKMISTLHGRFPLHRPYFYCAPCGHGFCPVDEALGLAPEVHQYDLQDAITVTAAKVPYEEAADLVRRLTGVSLSAHFGHDTLTRVAQTATLDVVIPERAEIERRIEQARGPSGEPPVLVVTADGAMAPVRPKAPRQGKRGAGGYREVRGVRLYLLGPDDEIIPIASWHQIQEAAAFRQDVARIAERVPQDQVRICLLADGAEWVWKALKAAFPGGREILDFFHCFEHLHVVARAQFGETSLAGHQWAELMMIRLADGAVMTALRSLLSTKPADATAKEEIRKLVGYLHGQAHRLHYIADLEEGFPIGSGAIESANKFLCHVRLKRSGAWWVEETGNDMLRIRCALYNDTYDRVFEHYMTSRGRDGSGGGAKEKDTGDR